MTSAYVLSLYQKKPESHGEKKKRTRQNIHTGSGIASNLYYVVVESKEKKSPRLGVEPRSPALVLVWDDKRKSWPLDHRGLVGSQCLILKYITKTIENKELLRQPLAVLCAHLLNNDLTPIHNSLQNYRITAIKYSISAIYATLDLI